MQRMASAYDGIQDYTALFLKRERVDGSLLPLETIDLRFQAPFKVYMAWRIPHAGRVIVYVEGENDSKIRVNSASPQQQGFQECITDAHQNAP